MARLEELPPDIAGLTLVQTLVRSVDVLDDEPGLAPPGLPLGVIRGLDHLLAHGDPLIIGLLANGVRFTKIN